MKNNPCYCYINNAKYFMSKIEHSDWMPDEQMSDNWKDGYSRGVAISRRL